MRSSTLIGILLIAIGIVAFVYQGISFTSNSKFVDMGPIQMTAESTSTIPLPPIVGGIALVTGIALLFLGKKSGS